MNRPFHAAYHVYDLNQARIFYRDVLGCTEGRSSETWIDFDFFGNQLSLHLGTPFEIPPVIRFAGEPGEQRTLFFLDPSGNPIEVKGFKDYAGLFAQ